MLDFMNLDIITIITAIVTIASAIAAITPTPKDNVIVATIYKFIIELPALNFGFAKK